MQAAILKVGLFHTAKNNLFHVVWMASNSLMPQEERTICAGVFIT